MPVNAREMRYTWVALYLGAACLLGAAACGRDTLPASRQRPEKRIDWLDGAPARAAKCKGDTYQRHECIQAAYGRE